MTCAVTGAVPEGVIAAATVSPQLIAVADLMIAAIRAGQVYRVAVMTKR